MWNGEEKLLCFLWRELLYYEHRFRFQRHSHAVAGNEYQIYDRAEGFLMKCIHSFLYKNTRSSNKLNKNLFCWPHWELTALLVRSARHSVWFASSSRSLIPILSTSSISHPLMASMVVSRYLKEIPKINLQLNKLISRLKVNKLPVFCYLR